jgi:predicted nucleotidyltransferase
MKVAVPVLAPILRSEAQGKILAQVMADPDAEHTVTALAAGAGTSLPTALREIERAENARLVVTRRLGNTRLVKANPANPLYRPYAEIILATYGPPAVILDELAAVKGIERLYLFGSWAARYSGERGPAPNDIDVLVIGRPDRDEVELAAERAERRLGVPVQVIIRTAKQWNDSTDPFVAEVRSRRLVSLCDEDDQ